MKIAFWSNGGNNMCVTSNMACITSIISLKNAGMKRELLLENHFNKERGLEKVLIHRFFKGNRWILCKVWVGVYTKEDIYWGNT